MRTTIDESGRVTLPGAIRQEAGLEPGTELEVVVDASSIRLTRAVPGPKIVRVGERLVARPTPSPEELPRVDIAELIEKERDRWP